MDRVHRKDRRDNERRGRGAEQFPGKQEQDERRNSVESDVADVKRRRARPRDAIVEGVTEDGERPVQPGI